MYSNRVHAVLSALSVFGMSRNIRFDPISLVFENSDELEQHYQRYLIHNSFVYVDDFFAQFTVITTSALVLFFLCEARYKVMISSVINCMLGAAVLVALRTSYRDYYLEQRNFLILALRTFRCSIFIIMYGEVTNNISAQALFFRLLLLGLSHVFWTCGMPLSIKAHVVHQATMIIVTCLYDKPLFCTQHLDLWNVVFEKFSPSKSLILSPGDRCSRVFFFSQFFLAFVLPTFILWVLELKSRLRYLRQLEIPLLGSLSSFYMGVLLLWASTFIWFLLAFY